MDNTVESLQCGVCYERYFRAFSAYHNGFGPLVNDSTKPDTFCSLQCEQSAAERARIEAISKGQTRGLTAFLIGCGVILFILVSIYG